MSFSNQIINFEALLYALAQQTESLPEDLQHSLTEVGRSLPEDRFDAARRMRELIQQYSPLEIAYKDALAQLDARYASQQRTKSLGATFPIASGLDELSIESLLLTNDWVNTAKQLINKLSTPQTPAKFWDKTDRMAITTAGGIALGSAIAQLPGALLGGVLGAGYGWYLGFRKPTESIKIESTHHARSISDDPLTTQSIDFYDLPTEQLAIMAREATTDAVKDLHYKGISTYGMRDGIIYETNPITDTQSVVEKDRQS